MHEIALAVFDLDGTIVDSEWAHEQAKRSIMGELGGGDVDIDLSYFTGRSNRVFWRAVLDKMGRDGDVDQLVARQFQYVVDALHRARQPESPGLTPLLRHLRDTGRKAAVCSGSDESFVRDILDYLGVAQWFDLVISAKDAARLKPAPDVYLAALNRAGMKAAHAIALEDSTSGVMAVHAAGMRVIGYTAGGDNPQDLSQADYLAPDLSRAIDILASIEEEACGS